MALNAGGAALAISAAVVDYRGKDLPMWWDAALRAAKVRVLTWIGRRPRHHQLSGTAVGTVTITAEGAVGLAPTPLTGDPVADRIAALEDEVRLQKMLTEGRFERVDGKIQQTQEVAASAVVSLREEIAQREAKAVTLETKTVSLEVYGLAMVAVGTLIQAIVSL